LFAASTDWLGQMSPTLISDIASRPRQGVLWREDSVRVDQVRGATGRDDAVFFALKPPLETAQRLSGLGWHLRDQLGLKGEPLRVRCFHVSLLGIGSWGRLSDEMLATVCEAAAALTMPRFLIAFDQAESFSGKPKRPLVLTGDEGVTGIRMLRHDLVRALREIGFMDGKDPTFTPHMTLLYDH